MFFLKENLPVMRSLFQNAKDLISHYCLVLKTRRFPGSVIYLVERGGWSIYEDGVSTCLELNKKGFRANIDFFLWGYKRTIIHFGSLHLFDKLFSLNHGSQNIYIVNVFHGSQDLDENIDRALSKLKQYQDHLFAINVTNSKMLDYLVEKGIDRNRIEILPVGYDPNLFCHKPASARLLAKKKLGLPLGVPIVGSFQKDGEGWGEGNSPKLIKGPDILVEVLGKVKKNYDFFVLLTGPSRGFVKNGLTAGGVQFKVCTTSSIQEMPLFYAAIDLYLICSRDEGGPKAVLEALACGTPLISSDVGVAKTILEQIQESKVIQGLDTVAFEKEVIEYVRYFEPSNITVVNEAVANKALRDYTWDSVATKCAELYHRAGMWS